MAPNVQYVYVFWISTEVRASLSGTVYLAEFGDNQRMNTWRNGESEVFDLRGVVLIM